MHDTGDDDGVRLDKWLWAARFFRTRALAAEAIDGGRVDVNGDRAKRSRQLAIGDLVAVRRPPWTHVVQVRGLSAARGPATVAATLYEETAPSRQARDALAAQLKAQGPDAAHEKGRPSRKERRDLGRWRGR